MTQATPHLQTRLTPQDLFLFNEGSHFRLHEKLGSHLDSLEGLVGVRFSVWAPDAESVHLIGDFNDWNKSNHPMSPVESSGIWSLFVPDLNQGEPYKYHIRSRIARYSVDKADPFALRCEMPPKTASVVHSLDYKWCDLEWMASRREKNSDRAPISIYELHIGSWDRVREDGFRSLHYREMAPRLVRYLLDNGFTHVEFLPVTEHPYYASWGYQVTSYFAPSSRYGSPQDLMYLIDQLHQHGLGVILDWVPSHFATDEHSLGYFDGTCLFEHADKRQGFHPDWGSFVFNYGRNEVRSFLISSAFFWLDKYHVDGLRVDGVASMLYLDYSRQQGEWIPNSYGGKENIEAIEFLKRLNHEVGVSFPDTIPIAEESTSWPMVSRPPYVGGLGFRMKWDMGWMHDTLQYMKLDPVFRKYHHHLLTFRMIYAFTENFVLSLSHDEVVHGKGSLLNKMSGDMWQKFANLRALYAYMWGMPGKKLLFMGGEFGQWQEWNHDDSLDWNLLEFSSHAGMQRWVRDLNKLYASEPALHQLDFSYEGFKWLECHDSDQSVFVFLRKAGKSEAPILIALNFTPIPRHDYRVGIPREGIWKEVLNSDAAAYWGSGVGNLGSVSSESIESHGHKQSIRLTIPPLGGIFLKGPQSEVSKLIREPPAVSQKDYRMTHSHQGLLAQLKQFTRPFWMLNIMEMIERLAYYGVRVVIPIYIAQADEINGLHFTQIQKGQIFFVWALIQSLVPMFSGGFADRYGYKKTIATSVLLTAAGYLLMGTQREYLSFMFGCSVLALGTAIFKPGIQGTLVQTISKETSSVGWGTFYMVVNVGGFLGPPLAHFLYGISWPTVFFGCACIVCLNLLMLLTYKEVPAGGDQRGNPWTIFMTTCVNMARPWWLIPVGMVLIALAFILPLNDNVRFAVVFVSLGALIVRTTRVGAFIWLMSGFWLMFMQLFDMLPNFIVDWVDSSSIVQTFGLPSWMTDVTPRGTMITQEWMINANSGLIVLCVVFVSFLVARMRRLSSILMGMTISAAGLVFAGFTMSGYLCLLGILCFSVGEMLASPKMNEYLGVIAPEGQKALYMGYANIPLAIGWSYGSLMGGEVYDKLGDKANLSLKYLASNFGITTDSSREAVAAKLQAAGLDPTRISQTLSDAYVQGEGILRAKATKFLGTVSGMDAMQVTNTLWNTYHPYKLWYQFAAIGIASAIGIAIYSHFAHKWQSKDV